MTDFSIQIVFRRGSKNISIIKVWPNRKFKIFEDYADIKLEVSSLLKGKICVCLLYLYQYYTDKYNPLVNTINQ